MSESVNQTPNMAAKVDAITGAIDAGLEQQPIALAHDHLMALEGEVWDEMQASVEGGWRTQEQAEAEFIKWRNAYTDIGRQAVRGSQTNGTHPQHVADNKRRMRRC